MGSFHDTMMRGRFSERAVTSVSLASIFEGMVVRKEKMSPRSSEPPRVTTSMMMLRRVMNNLLERPKKGKKNPCVFRIYFG